MIMRLHEDKDAFRVLHESIHKRTGYRADVLEKDYYVLLILHELTDFQQDGLLLQSDMSCGTATGLIFRQQ